MEDKRMQYYEYLRQVPETAKKKIGGGRLNGFTDINPMWRIKAMTECFGVCGVGWKYEIVRQWQETFGQEVKAFTNVALYIKTEEGWSDPIPGTGGSTLVEVGKQGLYVNDEGFKMSLTDALSVAMKALGVGADVYFQNDTKYGTKYAVQSKEAQPNKEVQLTNAPDATLNVIVEGTDMTAGEWLQNYALPAIKQANDKKSLVKIWDDYDFLQKNPVFFGAMTHRKKELGIK